MFILAECFNFPLAKRQIGAFETAAAAVAEAEKIGLVLIEEDSDNPGCFDALAKDGRLLTIEPATA